MGAESEEGEEAEGQEEEKKEEEGLEVPRWQAAQGPAQAEGPRGGGQEARGEEQELRQGDLQEVRVLRGPGGHHGPEEHDPRAGREGGRQDLRRRLHVQARGRHPEAPEVSALVVWS